MDYKEVLPEKFEKIQEGDIGIKTRTVIWYLAFSGFAINFILANSLPLAIVNMIDANYQSSIKNESEERVIIVSECIIETNFTNFSPKLSDEIKIAEHPKTTKHISPEGRLLNFLNIDYEREGFKWDEHKQAQVLGSFYWIHWVTQIPGGVLAAKYGTKFVFGFAHLAASLMAMTMPLLCYLDYQWLMALRIVQGFIMGLTWPAMHNLFGRWVPPNERSGFATAYFGGSVGAGMGLPLFGQLIRVSSWEWTFHACGICGIIWYLFWQYYVYDTPEQHPRIHPQEKKYILQSLGTSVAQINDKKPSVPWISILTSKVFLANIAGHWGIMFGILTLITQMPSYFKNVHGLGIEDTGLISGLPHLLLIPISIGFSKFADYLLSSEKISRNNVRRLSGFVGMVLNGCLVLGLAYSGCNLTLATILMTSALCSNATTSASVLSSVVDMAPNYAGITMGIMSTIGAISGFISPIVVGYLTFENQSVLAWQHVFEICGVMFIGCGIFYICLIDTAVQKWNNLSEIPDFDEEMKPLSTLHNRNQKA